MEIDIRLKVSEFIADGSEDEDNFASESIETHTTDDFPMTEQERAELMEAVEKTIKMHTFFTGSWDENGRNGVRTFMVSVAHIRPHVL